MRINNITALDYANKGGKLWIYFIETQFEAVRSMDTSQFVVTDNTGDTVETITGFSNVESIQYNASLDMFTAIFTPDIVDPEKDQLRAENEDLRSKLDGLAASLRADTLEIQADVSTLSQTATAKMMPVVQKLEGVTATVIKALGLTENDTSDNEDAEKI